MNTSPGLVVLTGLWNANDGLGRFPSGEQAELISLECSQVMQYQLIVLG